MEDLKTVTDLLVLKHLQTLGNQDLVKSFKKERKITTGFEVKTNLQDIISSYSKCKKSPSSLPSKPLPLAKLTKESPSQNSSDSSNDSDEGSSSSSGEDSDDSKVKTTDKNLQIMTSTPKPQSDEKQKESSSSSEDSDDEADTDDQRKNTTAGKKKHLTKHRKTPPG